MAIIKCPECDKEVSEKAQVCIHCGAPLIVNTSIKVKIPRFATGVLSQKAAKAQVLIDDSVIWDGYSGQVSVIDSKTSNKITVRILHAYTGHPFPFFRDFDIVGFVEPGKKYEIKSAEISMVFGDPSKSKWVLSEVDVIDSEL